MRLPSLNSTLDELKRFSNVDYIITDLDGTFVQHGTDVWGQLCGIQQKLYYGTTITIATGRTYWGAKDIAEKMRIKKGTPIVLYNGSIVLSYQTNNILYRKTMPHSIPYELSRMIDLKKQNLLVYYLIPGEEGNIVETVFGFGYGTFSRDFNNMKIMWHNVSCPDEVISILNAAQFSNWDSTLFHYDFAPCSVLIDKTAMDNHLETLMCYLNHNETLSYNDSGSGFLEISAKNVDKGIIFDYIQKESRKISIAIGDNDNDIELLQGADIGVAVANASSKAKKAAKFECKYEGAGGVLELINTIKAANRYC